MPPTYEEAKAAVESLNKLFAEFRKTNDDRLAAIEKSGVADPLFATKLAKIETDLQSALTITEAFAALQQKVNRIAVRDSTAGALGGIPLTDEQLAHRRAWLGDRGQKSGWLRTGHDAGLRELEQKALQVGVDKDGGYAVPADTSGRLIERITQVSPIRGIAAVEAIGSDALEGGADLDEAEDGWEGDTTTPPETKTPGLGVYRIPVHKQFAQPKASQTLLDDAIWDIEAWLIRKLQRRFAKREGAAFVAGDGVRKPRGFTTYPTAATADATRAWGVLEHVATGASGAWGSGANGADKLIELVHHLKAELRAGARFVMASLTLAGARQLKDGAGAYVWQPTLAAGQPSLLLGYPVTEAEDMPAVAANALAVAFGHFQEGYQIVDRAGFFMLRDPYTQKGKVLFYTTRRVGGDVVNFEAIKFLKFA